MKLKNTITEREKEIAFVAASVAAGCVPCLNHHKLKAQEVGITKDELLRIARYAFLVRRRASEFNIGKLDTVLTGDDTASENSPEEQEKYVPCC